ncbi:DUF5777 family beta-barrel protein [Niabella drilacis]|uniref:DUF5777 domain-containing protein n=1 Tax=Niabella drilacis (strain DSM 25811 / CCM 8410 / CCUG 62505 / LMG 26954 / E90) TaxID=1285928 RepID=A0A1G6YRM1_NIADE|nr:DUF5777 family beta-barrel protein [Niabella drilacis]SDD92941.1 hypothetical protein SAMN04487894_11670 [Niabella drilacis]
MKYLITATLLFAAPAIRAQEKDLLGLIDSTTSGQKEYVTGAFKSSRVINGHSIEFIGKNVLDVRILHRFGRINDGIGEFFGLDQASMRLGFDYGLGKNLTIGLGRSTAGKELDGFIKYRLIQQAAGVKGAAPFSVVLATGAALTTQKLAADAKYTDTKHRMAYYSEIIIGRKFTEAFSLQLAPAYVHRNLVQDLADNNDTYALGIGGRLKLSKRVAFVADYHYVISGLNKDIYKNPLSLGFDIETGGHVFQLHFSNATGMNEKAFITNTTDNWGSGEIRFGFNLSRVFTIGKRKTKIPPGS